MDSILLFQPVFAMASLTVVMWLWMYATRIPAMKKHQIHPQRAQNAERLKDLLPQEVTRVANNYNHLFEQPTLFYAVAISIAVLGHVDQIHVYCAWAYFVSRLVHSLIQATVDIVYARFFVFFFSWIILAVMVVRAALRVFGL